MLTPEIVNRNQDGDWTHSELLKFGGDRECIPKREWDEWCRVQGIETVIRSMESELEEDHPAFMRHFDDCEPGSVGWDPEPPGPEWHMLSIHDTEDGPVVIWYREATSEVEPGND